MKLNNTRCVKDLRYSNARTIKTFQDELISLKAIYVLSFRKLQKCLCRKTAYACPVPLHISEFSDIYKLQ